MASFGIGAGKEAPSHSQRIQRGEAAACIPGIGIPRFVGFQVDLGSS